MAKPFKPFAAPRGMHDLLPEDQKIWERVRLVAKNLSAAYGFLRIDTPHLEDTELFSVGVGRATDIVSKQMYSFKTRGGDALTLRPEGTAPVARAYVEHGMWNLPQPVKLYYFGSFFRHESPQRGRFREFHQWGLELIGDEQAVADAQIVQLFHLFFRELGFTQTVVEVNSIGCKACRPGYRQELTRYYRAKVKGLCRDCKDRFSQNPLRLLDCTQEKCVMVKKNAPQFLDHLCERCKRHLALLLEFFEELGIPYVLNPHLVRGLDYYTRTVFEFYLEADVLGGRPLPAVGEPGAHSEGQAEGKQPEKAEVPGEGRRLAICSGGRYDELIELLGGRPTPGVGGALGAERVVALVKHLALRVPEPAKPRVFIVQLGDLAKKKSLKLMEELRRAGIPMAESLGRDSIRSQLKIADRLGVEAALILGQKEALDEMLIVREMSTGVQETIPQAKLIETLKKKLKK